MQKKTVLMMFSTVLMLLSLIGVQPVKAAASFNTINSEVIQGDKNTVYMIFPSNEILNKPENVSGALESDWTALGFLYGACDNLQYIVTDTNQTIINTVTGEPIITDSIIVIFGGPLISAPGHYYQKYTMTPVYWTGDGVTHRFWRTSDDTQLADLLYSKVFSGSEDMFVIQTFTDDDNGNSVYLLYGFGWKGTFAAGIYFKDVILSDLKSNPDLYTNSYYIYKWTDENSNKFVELGEIKEVPPVP